jgi:microcystin degradation protein MlrC
MLDHIDGFTGYKTAPHVDCEETGAAAAEMLLRSLQSGKKLFTAFRRIPMLIAGEKSESEAEPMCSLIALSREEEKKDEIEAATFLLGFPWADNENEAACALVSAFAENKAAAEESAARLAASFWERRADFKFRSEYYDTETSVAKALEAVLATGCSPSGSQDASPSASPGYNPSEGPVFISDSGDNPTAGAAGDSTDLLEALLRRIDEIDRLPTPLLYSGFYDAPCAAALIAAGEGATVSTTLGGKWDTVNGKKIPLELRCEKIVRSFGPYKADLVLASYRNIRFTVTSKHIGFGDEDLLPALGVDARDYCLVAVKLGYLEPCFRTIARRAIMATTKGCSNEVLETIPYKKVRRPLYPLDKDMSSST